MSVRGRPRAGQGERVTFSFGQNWLEYSKTVTDATLAAAEYSLVEMLGGDHEIRNRSFLDVGCGSGLFSIAAARLGAHPVLGIDVDPASVRASIENASRFASDDCSFRLQTILDRAAVEALGSFDVVYAWGSLHHTGDMFRAIEITADRVAPGGTLALAIYNRWRGSLTLPSSEVWLRIKRMYNRMPLPAQKATVIAFLGMLGLQRIASRQPPFAKRDGRGMRDYHDAVDWLGGLPYEFASADEIAAFLARRGFDLLRAVAPVTPTGNNEFVFRRRAS